MTVQSGKVNHSLALHLCTVLSSCQQIPSVHLCSIYIILRNTDYIHPRLCLVFPGLCQSILLEFGVFLLNGSILNFLKDVEKGLLIVAYVMLYSSYLRCYFQ